MTAGYWPARCSGGRLRGLIDGRLTPLLITAAPCSHGAVGGRLWGSTMAVWTPLQVQQLPDGTLAVPRNSEPRTGGQYAYTMLSEVRALMPWPLGHELMQ